MDLSQIDLSKLNKKDLEGIIKILSSAGISTDTPTSTDNAQIVIGNCMMGPLALKILGEHYLNFEDYGIKRKANYNDVNLITSNLSYQKLFQQGFIYFEDDKWYNEFYISKPKMLMTFENVKNVVESNFGQDLINKLNELSEYKNCTNFMHYFPVMIAKMIRTEGYNPDYDKKRIISDYFNIELDKLIDLIEFYNKDIV